MADEVKYLICDITGFYSRIEFGKKGDKVRFINWSNEFGLVELNGERFHVKKENLSDVLIETEEKTEAIPDTVVKNKTDKRQSVSKKKAAVNNNQSTLF
ncbi:MAG TPA: hypothetical protein VF487_20170 [Chitinophagaceae bacterium]